MGFLEARWTFIFKFTQFSNIKVLNVNICYIIYLSKHYPCSLYDESVRWFCLSRIYTLN